MKNSRHFRDLPKEGLEIRLPIELAGRIRETAAKQRRSISEVGSEKIAVGFDLDPSEFGITPNVAAKSA